jgi:hypothetical protein
MTDVETFSLASIVAIWFAVVGPLAVLSIGVWLVRQAVTW